MILTFYVKETQKTAKGFVSRLPAKALLEHFFSFFNAL